VKILPTAALYYPVVQLPLSVCGWLSISEITTCATRLSCVGLHVLISVVVKSTIFSDITLCSPLKSQSSACHLLPYWLSCLAYSSTLKMEAYVPPKCRMTFTRLYSVISQKTVLFRLSYIYLSEELVHEPSLHRDSNIIRANIIIITLCLQQISINYLYPNSSEKSYK
jgi:hypothetical protein